MSASTHCFLFFPPFPYPSYTRMAMCSNPLFSNADADEDRCRCADDALLFEVEIAVQIGRVLLGVR